MTTWDRRVLIKNDAVAGGSSYDDLVAGAIPGATGAGSLAVPVDRATWDPNSVPLTRETEIRGGSRGTPPPVEFRDNPSIEFEAIAYPNLVKKTAVKAIGPDVKTGTPPAAITHALEPLVSGELAALHAELMYDGQLVKVAGLTIAEWTLDMPLLDWAKLTVNARGKYMVPNSGDVPSTPDYSGFPRRGYFLRDATVLLDGAPTTKLGGVRLVYSNGFADPPDYEPGLNREVIDDDGIRRVLWHPDEQRFLATSITGQLTFQAPKEEESFKRQIAHAEEMVVECEFEPLGTTPAATELLRFTAFEKVLTGGGPDQMSRLDKIQSTFDFGAFLDSSGDDFLLEFLDASNAVIT